MEPWRVALLVLLPLVACSPMTAPTKNTEQDIGGTTIVLRTTNRLPQKCAAETRPDLIDQQLSTPLMGYTVASPWADTELIEPPEPENTDKLKPSSVSVRGSPCYPGWKEWRGKRWRCRYEK
jgi:hypothetical protein